MPKRGRGHRSRGRVVLSAEDIARASDALVDVLPRTVVEIPATPANVREMLVPLGSTWRERLSRGAIALSGETDKRTRAYLSARRRLERYVSERAKERRRPRAGALEGLARRISRPRLDVDDELDVMVCADVIYVGQHKCPMPTVPPQRIRSTQLGTVRRMLRAGDEVGAGKALLDAFVYEYRLNDEHEARGIIGNISEISVTIARGK